LVVNCPGRVEATGKSDALVSLADVLPTMVDMAGVKLAKDYVFDGVSFAPILRGEKRLVREYLFSWCADKRFLRDERWLWDAEDKFWDCGGKRDEKGYKDVTGSGEPEAVEARRRFEEELKKYPNIAPDDPMVARYKKTLARMRKHYKRIHELNKGTDK
jgi:hypothetical protein